MGLDLNALKKQDLNHASRIAPVFDAAGNEYPGVAIMVVSVDSDKFTGFQRRAQQARLDKMARSGQLRLTADEIADEALDLLVACTVDWEGIEDTGEPLPCTPDNVRKLYTAAPWIREQVNQYIADRRHFFLSSRNGSANA